MPIRSVYFAILLIFLASNSWAEVQIEVYQPSHKTAASLQEAVAPIYGDQAKFSASDNRLIIQAEQSTLDKIQGLLMRLDKPARRYSLEISNTPGRAGTSTYSTASRSNTQQTFTVSEQQPLIVVKQSNAQTISGGLFWVETREIPIQQEALAIELQASEQDVYLNIRIQSLNNGQYNMTSNSVSGPLGEWLPISGGQVPENSSTWSTTSRDGSGLFVLVKPLD